MTAIAFRPRWPWVGADLQTVRNFIVRPRPDLSAWPATGRWFDLDDGTGDRLHGVAHAVPGRPDAPLVVVIHGLTGCADSYHVLVTAHRLLAAGFAVLRLNLRNAGPTLGRSAEQYHAGRTGDLRTLFAALAAEAPARPLAAVGYSLGGNMLLKYLGEEGGAAPLAAAASVSAPIDLAATAGRFDRSRNWLYGRLMLKWMKRDTLALGRAGAAVARAVADAVAPARSIREFDDRYIAPRYGFVTAEAYYARASSLPLLPDIRVPTLVVHALDDPWVCPEAYGRFRWDAQPALRPAILDQGGHVGFHGDAVGDVAGEGDGEVPWHDRRITAFLAEVLGVPAPASAPVRTIVPVKVGPGSGAGATAS